MVRKYWSCLVCVGLLLLTATIPACKGLSTNNSDKDSDSIKLAEAVNAMLPDTAFQSVDDLIYEVEVLDTITNGELNSLQDPYKGIDGILTFRGGQKRDARCFSGTVKGTPSNIVKDWSAETAVRGEWGGGSGWTGQPVYIKWTDEQVAQFKKSSPEITGYFSNEEIIVGSLCGEVYFIDYATGNNSRSPLDVGNPIKGSVSLDPALNGSLYVGHGIPDNQPFGHLAINLNTHERTYMWGRDPKAKRVWGAFDSSPIVAGQFLFWPGENGTIYKYERFGNGELKMHSALRYVVKGDRGAGIESSMAVYKNYGYVGDNHGDILCINLNTMKPVWHYDNHDDIDGSIVLEIENDVPYIYCGCEVDLQGDADAQTHFVKLNGLDGSLVWEWAAPSCRSYQGDKHFDGGLYCTPLLGDGNCKDMIFASFNQLDGKDTSEFLAFNKNTGKLIYRKPLDFYAWSSPVGFYNEKNELFVVIGNSSGHLYMFNGKTGDLLFDQVLSSNFESSPVVIGNTMVVGSRDGKIYRFHLE
ncbi:MAG: PQQ-like beta-propeller repeat protein [Muribaculaceae bacterium]|nr:PQQ-like beta-propeller repeat protein [Muribaculaceae bacterium]